MTDLDEDVVTVWIVQHCFLQIVDTVGIEEFTIEIVCDSASVLDLTDHVFDDCHVHLRLLASSWSHSSQVGKVFLNEHKGGFQVRVVEFVRNAPAQRTELSSLDDNRVKEANCEDHSSPVGTLNLIQELLSDECCECFVETSLQTFWWLICDLDDFLEQTKRESCVWLASDPKSEVFMWFNSIGVHEADNGLLAFFHELETELTVLKDDPSSTLSACFDDLSSDFLLTLSHRHFFSREFLLLPSKLVNGTGWISTS